MLDSKIKVLAICGTRPDSIKMAPVIKEIRRHLDDFEIVLAVTGQHREMLQQVLDAFELTADFDLNIMIQRQTLAQITTRALIGLEKIIAETQPNIILAQGDTTTTFVASLAAFYAKIPFGHVEAGLRTDNKYDPFPEEMNRRLTGILTDLHFAPTYRAKENLLNEGVDENSIYITGNTGIDALLSIAQKQHVFSDQKIAEAANGKMILMTAHRRENWGEKMRRICVAVKSLLQKYPDYNVIFPVHKNPIVREVVYPELGGEKRVLLIEPPDYVEFVHLMKSSQLILTDSGGVQEEAPSLGKPVLVLRETTERPEGVDAGNAKLVGTDPETIISEASKLLDDTREYMKMAQVANPYGDGHAAERIAGIIRDNFKNIVKQH